MQDTSKTKVGIPLLRGNVSHASLIKKTMVTLLSGANQIMQNNS